MTVEIPERWRYGPAGDRWPIQPGEVWRVGPHVVACGDIEQGGLDALVDWHNGPLALAYTDPPWNAGNARAFRTKAGLGRPVDYRALTDRIAAGLCRSGAPFAFVESGRALQDEIIGIYARRGLALVASWDITYYRIRPCRLHLFAQGQPPDRPEPWPAFTGLDDTQTPEVAIRAATEPGEAVLDPCTGLGATATACQRAGRRFVGLELHPRRLACTIDALVGLGIDPETVGPVGRLDLPSGG